MFKKVRTQIFKMLLEENMYVEDYEEDDQHVMIMGTAVFSDSDNSRHKLEIAIAMREEVK